MRKSRELKASEREMWSEATKGVKPLPCKRNVAPSIPNLVSQPYWRPVLDLHGLPVHEAWDQCKYHLETARQLGYSRVTIIPGRSGQISTEFENWLKNMGSVRKAKPRHGGGCWTLWL